MDPSIFKFNKNTFKSLKLQIIHYFHGQKAIYPRNFKIKTNRLN